MAIYTKLFTAGKSKTYKTPVIGSRTYLATFLNFKTSRIKKTTMNKIEILWNLLMDFMKTFGFVVDHLLLPPLLGSHRRSMPLALS